MPVRDSPLAFRRRLRRDATDAERALWALLRSRRLAGVKFRRQHTVGPYTLDLACTLRALALELDGGGHFSPEGRERDAVRDTWLAAHGWRVLRFTDREVLLEAEGVLEVIWARGQLAGVIPPTQTYFTVR